MELIQKFMEEIFVKDMTISIPYSVIFNQYENWILKYPNEKILGKKNFYCELRKINYLGSREIYIDNMLYLRGLNFKNNIQQNFKRLENFPAFPADQHKNFTSTIPKPSRLFLEQNETSSLVLEPDLTNSESFSDEENNNIIYFNEKEDYENFIMKEYNRIKKEKQEQQIVVVIEKMLNSQ